MFGEFKNVYDVLKKDDRLVASDGTLMKNRIYELSSKLDETFLQLLLDNEVTKNIFFKNINGIFVFNSQKFNWIIDSKEFLPDSYSEYKKDIMLVDDNNNSISKRDNVVLSFPYKDCILEMDSTEETEKRKEVFFNETLMKKEIDTLLSPKVFANAKGISKNGEETRILDYRTENNISDELLSIEYIPKTGKNKGTLYEQFYKDDACNLFVWLKDSSDEVNGMVFKKVIQGTLWDFVGETKNLTKEGQVQLANGKKPEKLIGKILDCCMKPGDIVLDAYLGSGTTAAVAHKKGLTYIGLEQLDKHIELAKTRLSNVINGDKSGISSDENWNGGGSYIYCELAENSQTYIDKIYKTNTIEELVDIFNFLKKSEFISYRVDINKMKDDDFIQLSIDDAKKVLISIIDKNTLYINYSDIDNEDYVIDDNDKAFTKDFYEGV